MMIGFSHAASVFFLQRSFSFLAREHIVYMYDEIVRQLPVVWCRMYLVTSE